jgi:hypothetical protein
VVGAVKASNETALHTIPLLDRQTGLTNRKIEFNFLLPTGFNLYLQRNLGS